MRWRNHCSAGACWDDLGFSNHWKCHRRATFTLWEHEQLCRVGWIMMLTLFASLVFPFCLQSIKSVGRTQSGGERCLQVSGRVAGSHQNGPVHRDFHGERIQFDGRRGSGDPRVSSLQILFTSCVGAGEGNKLFKNTREEAAERKPLPFVCSQQFLF